MEKADPGIMPFVGRSAPATSELGNKSFTFHLKNPARNATIVCSTYPDGTLHSVIVDQTENNMATTVALTDETSRLLRLSFLPGQLESLEKAAQISPLFAGLLNEFARIGGTIVIGAATKGTKAERGIGGAPVITIDSSWLLGGANQENHLCSLPHLLTS